MARTTENPENRMTPLHTKILATREAGYVKRGHNCRFLGEYNIAEHSWQALALLFRLHPAPSQRLIWGIAFHDVAERYFGDQPASVGWLAPELRAAQKVAEAEAARRLGIQFDLDEDEERWLLAIDRLELLMWTEDQAALGNRHVSNVDRTVREWFRDTWDRIPKPVQDYLSTYEWHRTSETELPQTP